MKRENLRAIAPKRFKPRTTDSNHDRQVSPNLLQSGANQPMDKGEVMVGDITYLPLRSGKFCYLAVLQDKFTRRIVGWAVSARMTTQLVLDALQMARRRWLIKSKAIIHTDRGSQYPSFEYQRVLYINGFRQSMSRRGNCYDNAQAESFFSRFKTELIEGGIFESVEETCSEVFSYIEGYYNRVRRQLALDLPEDAELFVDGGYNFYEWEDYLRDSEALRLQVPRRVNSKRIREPWLESYKSLMRKYIETTIGEIAKLFPKKIHATNLDGVLLKIALFLFAYQVDKAFIH